MSEAIVWNDRRCIMCHASAPLTEEHVIPRSLGGILTCSFLCKACNSNFGSGFEASARLAPEIRRSVAKLDCCPELMAQLEKGAEYRRDFDKQVVKSRVRPDGKFGTVELPDGSLIVPEHETEMKIGSVLKRDGASESEIKKAISMWKSGEAGETLELGSGVRVRKWENHPASPTYEEAQLSLLVPLKIAYEFAALLLGAAIYESNPHLRAMRNALVEQDEDFARRSVDALVASEPRPFHGIAFLGNAPEAEIQVRLFGYLAYKVLLPQTGINLKPLSYTHSLETGQHEARFITPRS